MALSSATAQSATAGQPSVAVAGTGDAFVTYVDGAGLWVRRYSKLTDAFEAQLSLDGQGFEGRAGADDAGGAMAAYVDAAGNVRARRFTRSGGNGTWAAAETIAAAPSANATPGLTDLAVSPSGHAVAAWTSNRFVSGSGTPSFIRVFEAGHGWDVARDVFGGKNAYTILTGLAEVAGALRIAASAEIVNTDGFIAILGSSYAYDLATHAGAAGSPVSIFAPANLHGYQSKLAMDGSGSAWLATYQSSGNADLTTLGTSVVGFRGAAWASSPTLLGSPPGAFAPTVAASRGGDALAAWETCVSAGTRTCAVHSRRSVGGAWQADAQLSASNLQLGTCAAALDGRGRALALWIEIASGGANAVMATELDPASGAWSSPHALERLTDATTTISDLLVDFGANGTGVAVWTTTPASSPATVRGAVFRY